MKTSMVIQYLLCHRHHIQMPVTMMSTDAAIAISNLALLYESHGEYDKAEPLFKRLLPILEKALGPDHPNVAYNLGPYARLLQATNRPGEAAKLRERADAILAKHRRP